MTFRPCNFHCPKCGSFDINRKFLVAGSTYSDSGIRTTWQVTLPSTEFVDRDDHLRFKVLKDCITHHCRCCQFQWDTSCMPQVDSVSQQPSPAAPQPAPAAPRRSLSWSDPQPPTDLAPYDRVMAYTPFGRLTIEWKSHKDRPGYSIGEFPGTPIGVPYLAADTLECAKKLAEDFFFSLVDKCHG